MTSKKTEVPTTSEEDIDDSISSSSSSSSAERIRDEFDVFGENIAIKLRTIRNSALRERIQSDINNLLCGVILRQQQIGKFSTRAPYIRNRLHQRIHEAREIEINCLDEASQQNINNVCITHDDGTEIYIKPFTTRSPVVYY